MNIKSRFASKRVPGRHAFSHVTPPKTDRIWLRKGERCIPLGRGVKLTKYVCLFISYSEICNLRMSPLTHPNEELAHSEMEATLRGDSEGVLDHHTEDIILHYPARNVLSGTYQGKDGQWERGGRHARS